MAVNIKYSAASNRGRKPFIATEESVVAPGPVIAESSTASNTTVRTRLQARLAAMATKSQPRQLPQPTSTAKATRSRKASTLTQLKAENINTDPNSQQPSSMLLLSTPSKWKARSKRPTPQSSSINKIILHRAKRSSRETPTKSFAGSSASSQSRQLFESTGKNSKQAYEESVAPGPVIAESSTAFNTTVRTRLQARLAAMATKSQPRQLPQPTSTAKATRSRKASTLTQLKAENINTDPNSQQPSSMLLLSTPSKWKARSKRPTPQSSSINKIILHRAKRSSRETTTKSSAGSSASSQSRQLFESTGKNSKQAYEESVAPGPVIAESSTAFNTTVRTRSQARLAATATKSQPRQLPQPTSTAKATRSRKAQPATPKSSGFIRSTDSTSKPKVTANLTPSKRAVVDLSTVRTSTQKGSSRLPVANSSHNTTPIKCTLPKRTGAASPALSGTPTMNSTRRQELAKNRQERLAMSEDKRKKADETKRAMLENRAMQLKEERAKRLEKVNENKKALEAMKKETKGHEHVQRPMTTRNAERRAKLAKLEAEKEAAAKVTHNGRGNQKAEQAASAPAKDSKSKLKVNAKKAITAASKKKPEPMNVDHMPPPPSSAILSPIAKPAMNGINTRLDETFTTATETPQQYPGTAASTPGQWTFAASTSYSTAHHPNVTFAITTGPAPSTPKAITSFALKKLKETPTTTSYQMTPPPRPVAEHNFDISKYIDSDDEEDQRAHEQANNGNTKRIPEWAQGRELLHQIHSQFGKNTSELTNLMASIFPSPLLPVPLDKMELPVREHYAVRTSSVNWKQAQVIDEVVAKIGGKK